MKPWRNQKWNEVTILKIEWCKYISLFYRLLSGRRVRIRPGTFKKSPGMSIMDPTSLQLVTGRVIIKKVDCCEQWVKKVCASSFVTLPLHLCFTIRGLQGLLFFLTHTLCFWSCLINAGDLPFGQGYTCHKVIACHLTRWDPTSSKICFGYDPFSWNICSIFLCKFQNA